MGFPEQWCLKAFAEVPGAAKRFRRQGRRSPKDTAAAQKYILAHIDEPVSRALTMCFCPP